MTTLRTAAQQALEVLENSSPDQYPEDAGVFYDAIDNLRAALAEPVQEPVAWMYSDDHERMLKTETFCTVYSVKVGSPDKGVTDVPLFTAPPQRKPLSAIDLRALYDRHAAYQEEGPEISGWWDFARAIERAHGIT